MPMIWLVNAAFVAKVRSNRFDPGPNAPNHPPSRS
jgi:hypothetical protein